MGKPEALPTGVEVHGTKLRIWFMYQGRRHREPVGLGVSASNIKAAARLRAQIDAEIKAGVFVYAAHFPESKHAGAGTGDIVTFGHLSGVWLSAKKGEVAKATYLKYEQMLDQYWIPPFGHRSVGSIKSSDVKSEMGKVDWSKLSAKRRNDAMIPLRGVFSLALEDELISVNPTASLKNKRSAPKMADPFTAAEVDLILNHMLRVYGEEVFAYFECAFFTGMRPGEQIEIQWPDADFPSEILDIQRNRNLGEVSDTKNHATRHHELNSRALHALGLMRKHTQLSGKHIFRHPKLLKPYHDLRPLREVFWDPTLKALGMRRRTLYQTRHTYATLNIMARAHPYWVAAQMGTSVELVYRTYAKWIKQVDSSVVEKSKMVRIV